MIGVHPRTLTLWADAGLIACATDRYGLHANPQQQRVYDRDTVIEIAQLRRQYGRRLIGILKGRVQMNPAERD